MMLSAKATQVIPVMVPAVTQFGSVMNMLSRGISSFLQTQFTKRMRFDISVANSFPGTTVPFVRFRVTFIFVILPVVFLLVLTAEPVFG